jgi:hypothetical protein
MLPGFAVGKSQRPLGRLGHVTAFRAVVQGFLHTVRGQAYHRS